MMFYMHVETVNHFNSVEVLVPVVYFSLLCILIFSSSELLFGMLLPEVSEGW